MKGRGRGAAAQIANHRQPGRIGKFCEGRIRLCCGSDTSTSRLHAVEAIARDVAHEGVSSLT